VNIKILMDRLVKKGSVKGRDERNRLLGEMTEEVAGLVLADNRGQSRAITLDGLRSARRRDELVAFARSRSGEPSVFCVGLVQLRLTLPLPYLVTAISNGVSVAEALPSETTMEMLPCTPTSLSLGTPYRRPVLVLNEAHEGLFLIECVKVSPSASDD
jgi:hypothetical protein